MFTGIIEELGTVKSVKPAGSGFDLTVKASKILEGMQTGDSIAIDGTCQTVTSFNSESFTVFSSKITAELTTLSHLKPRSEVNLERALTPAGRMGGHIVQGHVDGTGTVSGVFRDSAGIKINVSADSSIMKHIIAKGSVAVNGISLTVVEDNGSSFSLYLIPETIKNTTIPFLKTGDTVNIETDVLAKYMEKMIKGSNDDQLMRKLADNGFI